MSFFEFNENYLITYARIPSYLKVKTLQIFYEAYTDMYLVFFLILDLLMSC